MISCDDMIGDNRYNMKITELKETAVDLLTACRKEDPYLSIQPYENLTVYIFLTPDLFTKM